MNFSLPRSLEIGGCAYDIRSDYRDILTIITALNDTELTQEERVTVALCVFYPEMEKMPRENHAEAWEQFVTFLNGGRNDVPQQSARLMDWEHDFPYIVAPVNRVMGMEIRAVEYLHWWTFLSAYYEIGDCLFAQIVRIRDMKARGKKLDKADRDWYNRNHDLVNIPTQYTEAEQETLDRWIKGGGASG